MKYISLFKDENEAIQERYELCMERIDAILREETVSEPFRQYFHRTAVFIKLVSNTAGMAMEGRLGALSLSELKGLNQALYEDISGDNYHVSYTNPSYACTKLGDKFGKLLSFLATELRSIIVMPMNAGATSSRFIWSFLLRSIIILKRKTITPIRMSNGLFMTL
jgi:hypothetical protein